MTLGSALALVAVGACAGGSGRDGGSARGTSPGSTGGSTGSGPGTSPTSVASSAGTESTTTGASTSATSGAPTSVGSTSTDGGGTSSGVSCNDGIIDEGEICLDVVPEVIAVDPGPFDAAIGDIDVDGAPDIVTLHRVDGSTGSLVVLESDGLGGFVPPQSRAAPTDGFRVQVVDGDNDGDDDIAAAGYGGLTIYSNVDGSFLDPWNYGGTWFVAEAAVAEMLARRLDGDGIYDLLVTDAYGRLAMPGSGAGARWEVVDPPETFPVPGEGAAGIVAAKFDFDTGGDNDWDAVGLNQYESEAVMVTGNGDGTFTDAGTVDLCTGSFAGTRHGEAGDLDGDGTIDLVVTCMGGDFTVTLGNGDGTWANFEIYALDGAFRPRLVDIDADGDLDILVSSETLDRVVIFENDGAATFALQDVEFAVGGAVHGFAVADLDGNGALDVVVPWDDGDAGQISVFRAAP